MKLLRDFYDRDTIIVAKELLGKYFVKEAKSGRLAGKIVEVEAYCGPNDLACHASKGKTKRNEVMFGPPGYAYIYFTYGLFHMLNFVTEKEGYPAAVLIRALEPKEGLAIMKKNRNLGDIKNLCSGPGKITQAFKLTRAQNGLDLTEDFLFVEDRGEKPREIVTTPRIGVDYAKGYKDKPWRFYIKGNQFVSRRSL